MKATRRQLHSWPETMWTEFWTTAIIVKELQDLGFDIIFGKELYETQENELTERHKLPSPEATASAFNAAVIRLGDDELLRPMKGGFTGALARMRCGSDARMGFRFDIDGLPVKESGDPDHFPASEGFASVNDNMHACGHDGHAAIGLALAQRISEHREELDGDYFLLFQPAEEGGMGALVFSDREEIKELDAFFSLHLGLLAERKLICGLEFLTCKTFKVVFKGRSTHAAAAPDEGRNALLAATTAVNGLYALPRHKNGITRVNVGEFHSDNAMNVVADRTEFVMEVRGQHSDIREFLEKGAMNVLEGAARMNGVQVDVEEQSFHESVRNSEKLVDKVKDAALKAGIPEEAIQTKYLAPGCEDAPFIMKRVQENGGHAAYLLLGCDVKGGHHNPTFDFDEDLLDWGVEVLWGLARAHSVPS